MDRYKNIPENDCDRNYAGPGILLEKLRSQDDGALSLFKEDKIRWGKEGLRMQARLT